MSAKTLANQGRNGDTRIAHLTKGEVVVPKEVAALRPDIVKAVQEQITALGGKNPGKIVVGQGIKNPKTGLEEFASEAEVRAAFAALNREPDAGGFDWWLNSYTGNNFAADFAAGARANGETFNQSAFQSALNQARSPAPAPMPAPAPAPSSFQAPVSAPSQSQQSGGSLLPVSQTGVESLNGDGTYNSIVNNIDYSVRPDLKQFADRVGISPIEASNLLYGVVGANNDIRDWRAIMSSADPLKAVREANFQMINDPRYATKNPSYNLNPNVSRVLGQSGNLGVYQVAKVNGAQTAILSGDGRLLTTVANNDPAGLLRKLQEFGIPLNQVSGLADIYEKNNINYKPGTMYAGSDAGIDFRALANGQLGTSYNWLQDANAALKGPNGQEAVDQANRLAQYFNIGGQGVSTGSRTANATQSSPPSRDSINALYREVFGRDADTAGLDFYDQTDRNIEQIRREFLSSPEYLNRSSRAQSSGSGPSRDSINALYREVFGRDADTAGLDFYDQTDRDLNQIRRELLGSPEYSRRNGGASGAGGAGGAGGQPPSTEEINALYRQIFGRDADEAGLSFYDRTDRSLDQIRRELLASPEYRAINGGGGSGRGSASVPGGLASQTRGGFYSTTGPTLDEINRAFSEVNQSGDQRAKDALLTTGALQLMGQTKYTPRESIDPVSAVNGLFQTVFRA